MKLIDKDALVAEIERRISEYENCGIDNTAINAKIIALQSLLIYINTINVKEVDLKKYVCKNTFVEKACEYLMEYEFNDSPTISDRRKRIKSFVKYMKEE